MELNSSLLSFEKIVSLNRSNTSIDDLPNELVVNILSRLPVKTIVLSTCVSKKWYFIIKTPSLISAHLSRAVSDPATNYYIILVHTIFSQVNVFSDHAQCRLIRHPDINLPFETRSGSHKLIGACNGLVCLTDHSEKYEGRDIFLLNPFINKYRKLAVDSSTYVDLIGEIINSKTVDIRVGFGYSEVEDDYKVVRIIIRHADANRRGLFTPKVEIYSVKSRNWKRVNVSIKISKPSSYDIPVFAHGCLYWHVEDWGGRSRLDDYLLCFHLKDEVFSKIKLPTTYHELNRSWDRCIVAAKNDSVAVVLHTFGQNSSMRICLLVLEKKSDGEVYWKEFKYQCAEFSIKKCLGFSSRGRLIMSWGFPEKYLVAIDLDNDNSCVMEKVALYNTNIDDYFYGATNVFESLVLFSDSSCLLSFEKIVSLNGSNTSIDDLPNKLVVNILSRLPVKTLVLSTCVCKKWYFIIKTPSLISAHLSRAASDPATNYFIVLIHTIFSQVNVYSDHAQCRLIRHPDFNLPFKTRSGSHKLIGACNGLICLTDHSEKYEGRDIYLLNPFINKFRKLAVDSSTCVDLIGEIIDSKTVDIRVGFGYSEVEDDYKVVRIIIRHADANRRGLFTPKVEIYSVKSRNWKRVNVSIKISIPSSYDIPVFAHGCLYWHVEDHVGRSRIDYLLCFHLKDEVFSKIKLPGTYHELNLSWDRCIVAAKNDSVAVVLHTFGLNSAMRICLLVLEKKSDGEVYWKEFKYQCAEFSIKKCLGFSSRGRLIMNWGFPEKYLVAIDLDNNNSCVMEKVALYIRNIDDYFYGATNVFESLVLFSD